MPAEADLFDLQRFMAAQADVYPQALAELRAGEKRSHWMWFIFPQFDGLGSSAMARRYAIRSREEALCYLRHAVLGLRLRECVRALLELQDLRIDQILGFPDDLKLKSSMTLFAAVAPDPTSFAAVLDRYFGGERDAQTLRLLAGADS